MEIKLTLSFLILQLVLLVCAAKDELILVFEISRHGARAPVDEKYSKDFEVGTGMLTPSGMRQHYLLGRYLRKKYVDEMKFISSHYNQDEIHVSSTHMPRTIQSARCHLLGMFPPASTNKKVSDEKMFKSLPHIKLSGNYTGDSEDSIPGRYEPIAVNNNEIKRDSIYATGSCPYLAKQIESRKTNRKLWTKYDDYFKPRIYKQLADYFNMTEDSIHYLLAHDLGDVLISYEYEGLLKEGTFTEKEWKTISRLQLPWLLHTSTPLGNKLMVSKLLNPVIELMHWKMGREYDKRLVFPYRGTEKYVFYSSHDLMISNFLKFFQPEDLYYDRVDYASNFIFELYKRGDEEDKFFFKIFYNNQQIKLPGCKQMDCDFDEFEESFRDRGLTQEEVFYICNTGYYAPPGFDIPSI